MLYANKKATTNNEVMLKLNKTNFAGKLFMFTRKT